MQSRKLPSSSWGFLCSSEVMDLGEVFDLLDPQVVWALLLLQLGVIQWHEACRRCTNVVMVQRENRLLWQIIKFLMGGSWWSSKGQRAKHKTSTGESRLTSVLIKGKAALWVDTRGSKWVNMPMKETLLVPHWSSKSFNQSLQQLQEMGAVRTEGSAYVKSLIVASFSTLPSQIAFLLLLLALSPFPVKFLCGHKWLVRFL